MSEHQELLKKLENDLDRLDRAKLKGLILSLIQSDDTLAAKVRANLPADSSTRVPSTPRTSMVKTPRGAPATAAPKPAETHADGSVKTFGAGATARRISVFPNGVAARPTDAITLVIQKEEWGQLLDTITKKLRYQYPVTRLFTADDGAEVTSVDQISTGMKLVALSNNQKLSLPSQPSMSSTLARTKAVPSTPRDSEEPKPLPPPKPAVPRLSSGGPASSPAHDDSASKPPMTPRGTLKPANPNKPTLAARPVAKPAGSSRTLIAKPSGEPKEAPRAPARDEPEPNAQEVAPQSAAVPVEPSEEAAATAEPAPVEPEPVPEPEPAPKVEEPVAVEPVAAAAPSPPAPTSRTASPALKPTPEQVQERVNQRLADKIQKFRESQRELAPDPTPAPAAATPTANGTSHEAPAADDDETF
eukprot:TRINITY_DN4782_c0_g1_i3.p1 TRINITY_DN4782_c0_g1~~TRINITY_DN4782_c0_g1_i3.p1  ORF type:complete len:436 (+),score=111.67 TRINITY_DN4782_c0_g1_i3:60-1310(+)